MLNLLKLIPGVHYVYAALIALLLAGFGWYTHHERAVQAAKDKAADARVAAAAVVHNTEVETRAKSLTDAALAAYKATVAAPPPPGPVLVCHAAGSGQVPGHGGAAGGSNGAPAVPAASDGPPFNPAPAVIEDGRDADAQIKLLQALIRSYQAAGVVAKK